MSKDAAHTQYGTMYPGIDDVVPHKSLGSARYWAEQFSGIVVARNVTDWDRVDEGAVA